MKQSYAGALTLVLLVSLGIACGDDAAPGGEGGAAGVAGTGGEAGTGGVGGTGGEAGTGGTVPGEYMDAGVCRSTADFTTLGCPPTFDEALGLERCGGTPQCGGTCGQWLAVQDTCTPSLGCTYDPATRALVGAVFGSDTHDFCGLQSRDVVYGDGHHDCRFTDLVLDQDCPLKE